MKPASGTLLPRLEEAGGTLLALPPAGCSPRLLEMAGAWMRALPPLGPADLPDVPPPAPDAAAIARMEEALGWLAAVPPAMVNCRMLVLMRALVDPGTGKHLYSWSALARLLREDVPTVQSLHKAALGVIAWRLV